MAKWTKRRNDAKRNEARDKKRSMSWLVRSVASVVGRQRHGPRAQTASTSCKTIVICTGRYVRYIIQPSGFQSKTRALRTSRRSSATSGRSMPNAVKAVPRERKLTTHNLRSIYGVHDGLLVAKMGTRSQKAQGRKEVVHLSIKGGKVRGGDDDGLGVLDPSILALAGVGGGGARWDVSSRRGAGRVVVDRRLLR